MTDVSGIADKDRPDYWPRRFAELEARMRRLERQRNLEAATIGKGGLTIANGGAIKTTNYVPGTSGVRLDGATDTLEVNDLIVRDALIGNAALTSPISPAAYHAQAANFSLSTSAAQKVDLSVPVPAGYTRAIALATISATAVNTTSAQDTFLGYADVDYVGSPGGYLAGADAAPGYAAGIAHTETAFPTGLSGSLHFRGMLQSLNHAWSANAFNTINLDALVLFLR